MGTLRPRRVKETENAAAVGRASTDSANSKCQIEAAEDADSATLIKRPAKTSNASKRARVVLKFSFVETHVWTVVSGSRFVITSSLSFRDADGARGPQLDHLRTVEVSDA